MAEPILELLDLSKYYTSSGNVVMGLGNLNLRFFPGEFVAVTGESGSGKSTLSHVLCGVLPYESGEMLYCGEPTSQFDSADRERYRRDAVSFISQDYGILPGCTVTENVVSALRLSGMDKAAAIIRAEEILRQVDLGLLGKRRASGLSSGQKQRLSIARALAKPSRILIADEPTGNLDRENSIQIVRLLKQAAEDRLVIMVTHDFEEAADSVTRHIALRDGRVVLDTPLAPANDTVLPEKTESSPKQKLALYIAGLQLRAKPGWSGLLLLFFTLTAFAVFAFLGSFIVALDDTPTRIYDNSAFRNGDPRRIVAAREDGEAMTEEDYVNLLGAAEVISLERSGYLADMNYAYRKDVDYRVRYHLEGGSVDTNGKSASGITFENTEIFTQSVPLYADGREFLSAGRLPETMYEVVAAGNPSQIGQVIEVYVQNRQKWSTSYYLKIDALVVGTTNEGSGLYFHEDLGLVMVESYAETKRGVAWMVAPYYAEDLTGKTLVSEEILAGLKPNQEPILSLWTLDHGEIVELEIAGTHDSTHPATLLVSDEVFRKTVSQNHHNQVSLTITDYAYADRVVESLQSMGYVAISPYQQGSTRQNSTLAAQRMQTLKITLGAFAVSVLLQIVVLRGMFSVQTENYRLLSNIGLLANTALKSMLWQHLMLCLCGQLLGLGGIYVCNALGIRQIVQLVYYLPPVYALLLSGIHFAVCLLTAAIACRDLMGRVYPDSARFDDLPGKEAAV